MLAISRSGDLLNSLSQASRHNNIDILEGDIVLLTKEAETLSRELSGRFRRIDILINNAGIVIPKPFRELSDIENELVIETNFVSPMRLIRIILPLLRRGSHVVNIGSMGGVQGSAKYPGLSVYSSAKAALSVLTESLASEFNGTGIHFNCLSLGSVQTEMLETAFPGYKAPIGAGEMAGFVSWFALNGQKFFNGKVLPVSVANP
ncbi:MAG: SDR family oxidoreductase [Bacteroidia bacterium]|nr:MAG: SDR family oxidoreductase [Bacteroidia bacterium]